MATIKETTTTTAPAEPLVDGKKIVQNLAFKLWSRAGARDAIETMHPLWSSYRVDCELSKNWHALSADAQKPWLDRAAENKKRFDAKKALVATVLAPAPAPTPMALAQPESAVALVVAPGAEPALEPAAAAAAEPVPMEDAPEPAVPPLRVGAVVDASAVAFGEVYVKKARNGGPQKFRGTIVAESMDDDCWNVKYDEDGKVYATEAQHLTLVVAPIIELAPAPVAAAAAAAGPVPMEDASEPAAVLAPAPMEPAQLEPAVEPAATTPTKKASKTDPFGCPDPVIEAPVRRAKKRGDAPAPMVLSQPEPAVAPVVAPRAEPAPEPVAAAEAGPVPMEDAPEPAAELAPAPAPMALPQPEPVGPVVAPMGLSVGDKVEALWPANGLYYPALVTAIHDNGTIALYYDDGDTRSDARVSELRTIVSESDDEDIPAAPKSQYEIERDERIARNEAFMRSLGLGGGLSGLAAVGAQIGRPAVAPRPKRPRDWEPREGERKSGRLAGDEPEFEMVENPDAVVTGLAAAPSPKPPPKKLPRKKAPAAAPAAAAAPQTSAALSSLGRRLNTEVNGLALALVRASPAEAQFLAHDLLVASREYDALQDAAGALRMSEALPERLKAAQAPKATKAKPKPAPKKKKPAKKSVLKPLAAPAPTIKGCVVSDQGFVRDVATGHLRGRVAIAATRKVIDIFKASKQASQYGTPFGAAVPLKDLDLRSDPTLGEVAKKLRPGAKMDVGRNIFEGEPISLAGEDGVEYWGWIAQNKHPSWTKTSKWLFVAVQEVEK